MADLMGRTRRRLLSGLVAVASAALAGCTAPSVRRSGAAEPTPAARAASAAVPTPEVITFVGSGPRKAADHLALPLQLVIPKIAVQAPVIAVGLTPSGAMDVPRRAGDIGWYQYSPRPGMKGNSVLGGHLDWYGVEGVFRRLAELGTGDQVIVRGSDGQEREYGVEWQREYVADGAPVVQIFEALEFPALTLITCGGRWNPMTQQYDRRVVVRARR